MTTRYLFEQSILCCTYHATLSNLDRCLQHFNDMNNIKSSNCPTLNRYKFIFIYIVILHILPIIIILINNKKLTALETFITRSQGFMADLIYVYIMFTKEMVELVQDLFG